MDDLKPLVVWAVVYGNYHPHEVHALYDNAAAAENHAAAMSRPGEWGVTRWIVESSYYAEVHP